MCIIRNKKIFFLKRGAFSSLVLQIEREREKEMGHRPDNINRLINIRRVSCSEEKIQLRAFPWQFDWLIEEWGMSVN